MNNYVHVDLSKYMQDKAVDMTARSLAFESDSDMKTMRTDIEAVTRIVYFLLPYILPWVSEEKEETDSDRIQRRLIEFATVAWPSSTAAIHTYERGVFLSSNICLWSWREYLVILSFCFFHQAIHERQTWQRHLDLLRARSSHTWRSRVIDAVSPLPQEVDSVDQLFHLDILRREAKSTRVRGRESTRHSCLLRVESLFSDSFSCLWFTEWFELWIFVILIALMVGELFSTYWWRQSKVGVIDVVDWTTMDWS